MVQHHLAESARAGANLEHVEPSKRSGLPASLGEEPPLADAIILGIDLSFAKGVPLRPEIAGVIFWIANARHTRNDRKPVAVLVGERRSVVLERQSVGGIDQGHHHQTG